MSSYCVVGTQAARFGAMREREQGEGAVSTHARFTFTFTTISLHIAT